MAFDVNLGPFLQILFHHADETVISDRDAVPFGAFLAFAGFLVLPAFACGEAERCCLAAILKAADFGVFAEMADKLNVVVAVVWTGSGKNKLRPVAD